KVSHGCQLIFRGLCPAVGCRIPGAFAGILDRWYAWPSAARSRKSVSWLSAYIQGAMPCRRLPDTWCVCGHSGSMVRMAVCSSFQKKCLMVVSLYSGGYALP
ncbi:hypothetical protein OB446_027840, partial [Paenibacillus alvei]